jgi:hypothetical protein
MNDDRDYYSGEYKPFSISGYIAQAVVIDAGIYMATGVSPIDVVTRLITGDRSPAWEPPDRHPVTEEDRLALLTKRYRRKYGYPPHLSADPEERLQILSERYRQKYGNR